MNKSVYISGKISGLPIVLAKSNFGRIEKKLLKLGYKPVNPFELPFKCNNWYFRMAICLIALTFCKYVYFMRNWEDSRGARIEYKWAKFLGKEIIGL